MTVIYAADKVDEFIQLADAIEDEFPELQVDGEEANDPKHKFSVTKENGDVVTETNSPDVPDASSVIESLRQAGFR